MRTKTKYFIGYCAFCLTVTALEQWGVRHADTGFRWLMLAASLLASSVAGVAYWQAAPRHWGE